MRKPRLSKLEKEMFVDPIIAHFYRDYDGYDLYYTKAEHKAIESVINKIYNYFDI